MTRRKSRLSYHRDINYAVLEAFHIRGDKAKPAIKHFCGRGGIDGKRTFGKIFTYPFKNLFSHSRTAMLSVNKGKAYVAVVPYRHHTDDGAAFRTDVAFHIARFDVLFQLISHNECRKMLPSRGGIYLRFNFIEHSECKGQCLVYAAVIGRQQLCYSHFLSARAS